MSERTLKETLKNMEEKKILIANTVNRKKYYKISNKRIPQELQLEIRASVVYDVVKGYLTQEELQFYCFLRYLQHEQRRLQPSIGGNKFIMTQEDISKKYGVTRKCVNELIHHSPLPDKNISIKKSELKFVADSNSELLVCPICGELTKKPKSINCNEIYKCIWCNCDFKLKEEYYE